MGPTASGKSAMGVRIAQKCGGVILNGDAMQCYRDLRIITARPVEGEMAGVEHQLYGMWEARSMGNAALWLEAAAQAIQAVHAAGKVPIILGGTGLYIQGLYAGLSPVPPISDDVKAQAATIEAPYQALQQHDPRIAERLSPGDTQRVGRALEVMLETGRSLLDWQGEASPAPVTREQCHLAYIDIPREELYARIDARFEAMLAQGAIEEVKALKAQFSPEEIAEQRFPILKAHGAPELMAYLDGEMSLERATELGQRNTRRYAKRQLTWLRGQASEAALLPWDGGDAAAEGWLNTLPSLRGAM